MILFPRGKILLSLNKEKKDSYYITKLGEEYNCLPVDKKLFICLLEYDYEEKCKKFNNVVNFLNFTSVKYNIVIDEFGEKYKYLSIALKDAIILKK